MSETFRVWELAVLFCISVIVIFFRAACNEDDFTVADVFSTFCKALLIVSLCKIYLAL